MDETFEIPVRYRGQEELFPARLRVQGFQHRIEVEVDGFDVLFEPDEERNYRAVVNPAHLERIKKMDIDLLKAIAQAIEEIVK